MAIRSALSRAARQPPLSAPAGAAVTSARVRFFSDDKGKILSEEERAKENVYVHKWERERLEKAKQKAEKEHAEAEKAKSSDKKADDSRK